MSTKTNYVLKVLHVISWIIFIGVCLEAGIFIVSTVLPLILSPEDAAKTWREVDLLELYNINQSHFVTVSSLMSIVAVLKAIMFYIIVKAFHSKKFSLSQPFNEPVKRFILILAYLAFGIGFFSSWGTGYVDGLVAQGIKMPGIQHLKLAGADVWLFMGVTLLVIAQVFKKGIELQHENDLTV
jgi:hypothetical protein